MDISWCQCNPRYIQSIMDGLAENKTLTEVDMRNMPITGTQSEEIVEKIYTFIRKNKSLLHLDLSYMGMSPSEVLRLAEACSKCRTLLSLHLTGN